MSCLPAGSKPGQRGSYAWVQTGMPAWGDVSHACPLARQPGGVPRALGGGPGRAHRSAHAHYLHLQARLHRISFSFRLAAAHSLFTCPSLAPSHQLQGWTQEELPPHLSPTPFTQDFILVQPSVPFPAAGRTQEGYGDFRLHELSPSTHSVWAHFQMRWNLPPFACCRAHPGGGL